MGGLRGFWWNLSGQVVQIKTNRWFQLDYIAVIKQQITALKIKECDNRIWRGGDSLFTLTTSNASIDVYQRNSWPAVCAAAGSKWRTCLDISITCLVCSQYNLPKFPMQLVAFRTRICRTCSNPLAQ